VRGQHLAGRNNDQVTAIQLSNQQAQTHGSFPSNIEGFFPNIISIRVVNSLVEITQSDFKPFPELQELDLNQNNFRSIPARSFDGNIRLRYISFRQNRSLRHLAHHLFYHLNLASLDARDIYCLSTSASSANQIEQLIFNLSRSCPPTTRMIIEEILSDESWSTGDGDLKKRLEIVEKRVNDHEPRVKNLESGQKLIVDEVNFIMSRVFPQG
jgi:hypothetical protein